MAEEKRVTHVRKHIGRKIQTKQFESAEIYVEAEDTIEWTDVKDRQAKMDKITKLLILDFQRTMDDVTKELGLKENKATISAPKETDNSKKETKKKVNSEDLFDDM